MPVCWLLKAALAPLMAAPEESNTVPDTVPRLVWQWAVAVNASENSTFRKIRAIPRAMRSCDYSAEWTLSASTHRGNAAGEMGCVGSA